MDIILVRHGETAWNVGEVFRGRADVELNDNGRRQAALLGRYLADTSLEGIYSSPLQRALDTAQAIAEHRKVEVQAREELHDLDFGEWEGLQVVEVRAKYPELFSQWAENPEKVRLPGGETLDDVTRRSLKIIEEVTRRHRENVILVTHRVVIKILVCALLGLDNSHFWNIMVDTCGLTTFRYEKSRFVLIRHNDNSFLRSLQLSPLKDF
jgi:alpha-ribazole phosphatase